MKEGRRIKRIPCSLEVVSVAVCNTALVRKLLLLALRGEPGIKDLHYNEVQDQDKCQKSGIRIWIKEEVNLCWMAVL